MKRYSLSTHKTTFTSSLILTALTLGGCLPTENVVVKSAADSPIGLSGQQNQRIRPNLRPPVTPFPRAPLNPEAPWPKLPRYPGQAVEFTSVKDYQANGADDLDDTAAIRAAVEQAKPDSSGMKNIFFPPGRYLVSGPITLSSKTRIFGEGTSSLIVQQRVNTHVFQASGTPTAFVTDINIDKLGIEGKTVQPGSLSDKRGPGQVLFVRSARRVRLSNVSVTGMSLFFSDLAWPIKPYNMWDGTYDPVASAGLVREDQLNSDIQILNNKARGPGSHMVEAIYIRFAKDVLVQGSRNIEHYAHGIVWWGGDASPERGGRSDNPAWVRNLRVIGNEVNDTTGGIWGAMGENIVVENNTVRRCEDVCLDAEGSRNVVFRRNVASNAVNGVLATFHFSRDILFEENIVSQDGSLGHALFHHHNHTQLSADTRTHSAASVTLRKNIMTYTGPTCESPVRACIGTLSGDAFRELRIEKNQLNNVVIDLIGTNSGNVTIRKNRIRISRSVFDSMPRDEGTLLSAPAAIRIANTNIVMTKAGEHIGRSDQLTIAGKVVISRNSIVSSVRGEDAPGIFIYQSSYNSAPSTGVTSNKVSGFRTSVRVHGESQNPGMVMPFKISWNRVNGRVLDTSPKGRSRTRKSWNF